MVARVRWAMRGMRHGSRVATDTERNVFIIADFAKTGNEDGEQRNCCKGRQPSVVRPSDLQSTISLRYNEHHQHISLSATAYSYGARTIIIAALNPKLENWRSS